MSDRPLYSDTGDNTGAVPDRGSPRGMLVERHNEAHPA